MDSFFGIGIAELFFIAVLALIVLGPERLPSTLRQIAKWWGYARNLGRELTSQFGEEFKALEDLNPRKILNEMADEELAKELNLKPSATARTTTNKTTIKPASNTTTKSTAAKPATKPAPKSTTTTAKTTTAKSTPAKPSTAAKSPAEPAAESAETGAEPAKSTAETEPTILPDTLAEPAADSPAPASTTASDDASIAAAETPTVDKSPLTTAATSSNVQVNGGAANADPSENQA